MWSTQQLQQHDSTVECDWRWILLLVSFSLLIFSSFTDGTERREGRGRLPFCLDVRQPSLSRLGSGGLISFFRKRNGWLRATIFSYIFVCVVRELIIAPPGRSTLTECLISSDSHVWARVTTDSRRLAARRGGGNSWGLFFSSSWDVNCVQHLSIQRPPQLLFLFCIDWIHKELNLVPRN